ncbi:YceI family protein [Mucilaginibacter sp. RS28]|uniref:YceI family protein n=1 Tax=Mucilaginibacter straminoryzae TaxID=2932774 RepID=A0A9X1XA80_9SPHI|nr:YceI family protein [Mucilaginibacter straminoryzae]MCJ8211054.1 YceI family protein [Mucilaginibacter straminoryzae]
MKKFLFIITTLLFAAGAHAQVYMTANGKVQFFSETPLENIVATNNNVSTLINTATDSILVRMKNTGFTFKNALMQEHFNENYMESSKYPYDTFRGKLNQKIDYAKDGVYKVSATGKITIHGTERNTTINGTLTVKNETIHLDAEFIAHTADFNIEVPKLVFEKIAENIRVTMNADYKPVKK